jgi:uncharacterized lipoprotein YmbA
MSLRITRLIVFGIAFPLLAACLNLGGSPSTATRFFLLESRPAAALTPTTADAPAAFTLGVGPVTIPAYLDRPQIVTRADGNELLVDDFRQWAEPLRSAVTRVMREDLTLATGARHVYAHPWNRSAAIDFQVGLDVIRFEADTAGAVTLIAVWRILATDGRRSTLVHEQRSTIVRPLDGATGVDAMSTALADLSQEVAAVLVEISR